MAMAAAWLPPLLPTKSLNHPRLLPLPCKVPTAAPRALLISFPPPAATRLRRGLPAAAQEPAAGYQYDDGEEYEDEEEYYGDEDEGEWEEEEMDVEAMELEARGAAADLAASLARELRIGGKELEDLVPLFLIKSLEKLAFKPPPRTRGGKRGRVYYTTQAASRPPTFVFFVNDAKLFPETYRHYMEKQLRSDAGFPGTPIRLLWRSRRRPDKQGKSAEDNSQSSGTPSRMLLAA